jgi:hypothetical protein
MSTAAGSGPECQPLLEIRLGGEAHACIVKHTVGWRKPTRRLPARSELCQVAVCKLFRGSSGAYLSAACVLSLGLLSCAGQQSQGMKFLRPWYNKGL